MANVIKLSKGLDINLKGQAAKNVVTVDCGSEFALVPDDFVGVTPKVVVKEGDQVLAGDALFVNKHYPSVKFASPVSGTVKAVVRGDRRKVMSVVVEADKDQQARDFGKKNVNALSGEQVKEALLEAGLFGYINQLPYAISTNPETEPKAIFVSALRDMPLAADFEVELKGNEEAWQAGITALSKMAKTYVGLGSKQTAAALLQTKDAEVNIFNGKCPAGNVGVQVNNIDPVNKGEVVWTVDPSAVIFIGRLMLTGKVDLTRVIAVAGSEIKTPQYVKVLVGQKLGTVLEGQIAEGANARIINGNPLVGRKACKNCYVGAHTSEVTAIPEGDHADEMLGWILPRPNQFSVNRSYLSWLMPKSKQYDCDTRIKGGERHMIMSGEYDTVLPMDIYGEYLIKAIITGDIDRQEALGIYEVAPEDFAVAEFIDSSKLELQKIVREGLDILRKENA